MRLPCSVPVRRPPSHLELGGNLQVASRRPLSFTKSSLQRFRTLFLIVASLTAWTLPVLHSHAQEGPIVVALAVDTSGSIEDADLDLVRYLSLDVLSKLPPGSKVALYSFNDEPTKLLDPSSDPSAIAAKFRNLRRGGKFTAIYDALFEIVQFLEKHPARSKAGILISDGKEENSDVTLEDGANEAIQAHIPIFTIGIGRIQDQNLRRIARLTGGEYSDIQDAQALDLAQAIRKAAAPKELMAPQSPPGTNAALAPTTSTPASSNQPQPDEKGVEQLASKPHRSPLFWIGAAGIILFLGLASLFAIRYLQATGNSATAQPYVSCGSCGSPLPVLGAICPNCAVPPGTTRPITFPLAPALPPIPPPLPFTATTESMPRVESPIEKTVRLRASTASLTIITGRGSGQHFQLKFDAPTVIGRGQAVAIRLHDDLAASQAHCQIDYAQACFTLRDLGSTNGTFRNGDNIGRTPYVLMDRDRIQVGETVFEYRIQESN